MKRVFLFISIPVAALIFALIARPFSMGVKLVQTAEDYALALSSGDTEEAMNMMTASTADELSAQFLSRLEGTEVPVNFRYDGSDARGLRMVGSIQGQEFGSRVIWLSADNGILVAYDTALDNILGSAVLLCRENALTDPDGCCPVSGKPYEYNQETGMVICAEDHLGEGILIFSDRCSLRRDSVAVELAEYLEAGYPLPENLEEMFTVSDEEYGRRGGYRCPDNGYKYYELRDGEIYCPFHEESSETMVTR